MTSTNPPGPDPDRNEPNASGGGALDPLTQLLRDMEGTGTADATAPSTGTAADDAAPSGTTTETGAPAATSGVRIDSTPPPVPADAPKSRRARRHRLRNAPRWVKITAAIVVVILLIPTASFVKAVATPNNLSFAERGAEWMRDNGLGGVLNTIEGWWLSKNQPKEGGEPDRAIGTYESGNSGPSTTVKVIAPHLPKPPNVQVPEGVTPVANEGVWQPVGPLIGGAQPMYTTQVRPDSIHTSILDGLVWMDPKLVSFEQFPGTEEPGGRWDKPSQVPMDRRLDLLAAFNSGFRMQDARGGFYMDGVMRKELRDGAASMVIYKDGTASIGMWGRDFTMNDRIAAVRQNLDLIIDNGGGPPNPGGVPAATAAPGVPAAGLSDNSDGAWGATFGNKILAWRSAVGVTADGAIVYGYGDGLGALSLAQLMLRAGCVRAMEMDINTVWTTFNFYSATQFLDPASVQGTKLLPESFKGANRYLSPDARDFVGVFARKL